MKEEVEPTLPEELAYLWARFVDIARGEIITFSEILSYCELTGAKITGWEAGVIRTLDYTYRRVHAEP